MDASTGYATNENNEIRVIDPTELENTATVDDDYMAKWNDYVEQSDFDDWDEDDQLDADAIAASAVFMDDGWQSHFMRRMISEMNDEKIDWQNLEITKFKAEVEGKQAVSEMIDREINWRKTQIRAPK